MTLDLNLIVGILSILLSVVAAWYSYEIYKSNRLTKGWLAVTLAFVIMIIRRVIGFFSGDYPDLEVRNYMKMTEFVLQIVISLLYIYGFWVMKKRFENFDVVENETETKIKKLKMG